MVNQVVSFRFIFVFILVGSIISISILTSRMNYAYSEFELPVDNHMIRTTIKDHSPILNTDYGKHATIFSISTLSNSSALGTADESDPLFPINSSPYGIDYKRWAIYYLQNDMSEWYKGFPQTNDNCYYMNNGTVKMLANPFSLEKGRHATYNCNFDTTDSYFFTLFMESCDYAKVKSDPLLDICVVEHNKDARGQVWLDGVELQNLDSYRITTDHFKINYTKPNPVNIPEGSYRALLNGLFLFIKPLPPGDHELKYSMIQITGNKLNDFAASITYKLHITEKV